MCEDYSHLLLVLRLPVATVLYCCLLSHSPAKIMIRHWLVVFSPPPPPPLATQTHTTTTMNLTRRCRSCCRGNRAKFYGAAALCRLCCVAPIVVLVVVTSSTINHTFALLESLQKKKGAKDIRHLKLSSRILRKIPGTHYAIPAG